MIKYSNTLIQNECETRLNFHYFLNDIKLDENFDSIKTIQNIKNQKQKITILDNDNVQIFVIHAKSKIFFEFLDKQN